MQLDLCLSLDSPHAHSTLEDRAAVHRKVLALQELASQRMKTHDDAHRHEADLEEGQRVWLRTTHLPLKEGTRKMA